MVTTTLSAPHKSETPFKLDARFFEEQVSNIIEQILPRYERMIKNVIFFQCFFAVVGFAELLFFVSFFPFLAESSVLAFALALMFLTLFGYLTLHLYLKSQKPQQFEQVADAYYQACYQLLEIQEEKAEHYVTLASALCKFSSALKGREQHIYRPPLGLKFFEASFEQFSHRCHQEDIRKMREKLLLSAVMEHVKLVKLEPTSLESHAALANAYVMLSEIYQKETPEFRQTAERAIEELHILHDFAPTDPWIHVQLAYSYHDLQMPVEEIREYEKVLELCPHDQDAIYKLGLLYFQEGMNAKGLKVYEILMKVNPRRAEKLIIEYGAKS